MLNDLTNFPWYCSLARFFFDIHFPLHHRTLRRPSSVSGLHCTTNCPMVHNFLPIPAFAFTRTGVLLESSHLLWIFTCHYAPVCTVLGYIKRKKTEKKFFYACAFIGFLNWLYGSLPPKRCVALVLDCAGVGREEQPVTFTWN